MKNKINGLITHINNNIQKGGEGTLELAAIKTYYIYQHRHNRYYTLRELNDQKENKEDMLKVLKMLNFVLKKTEK